MGKKILVVVIAVFIYIIIITIAVGLIGQFPSYDKLIVAVFGAITVFMGYVLKPAYEEIERIITTPSKAQKVCNIYLFGLGGSGKTTLVKSWVGGDVDNTRETQDFTYYERKAIKINQKSIDAMIADYQGQNPAQIIVNILRQKSSSKKPYVVNTIVFIVDIIGVEDENGNPLRTPASQINYLVSDTQEKIAQRVRKHENYIIGALNFLFYFMISPDLVSIKLVINKYDVLKEIVNQGYITGVRVADIQDYVKNLFTEIETVLTNVKQQNQILDFNVHFISAETHEGTNELLDNILRVYEKHIGRKTTP